MASLEPESAERVLPAVQEEEKKKREEERARRGVRDSDKPKGAAAEITCEERRIVLSGLLLLLQPNAKVGLLVTASSISELLAGPGVPQC